MELNTELKWNPNGTQMKAKWSPNRTRTEPEWNGTRIVKLMCVCLTCNLIICFSGVCGSQCGGLWWAIRLAGELKNRTVRLSNLRAENGANLKAIRLIGMCVQCGNTKILKFTEEIGCLRTPVRAGAYWLTGTPRRFSKEENELNKFIGSTGDRLSAPFERGVESDTRRRSEFASKRD